MGKSSPKAPAAPDPVVTSAAQTSSNRETAYYNALLNNVTQITPYGSLTYKNTGTEANPKFTATQTLSNQQQKILDQTTANERALLGMGSAQLSRINKAVSTPFSYSGAPAVAQDPKNLTALRQPDYNNLPTASKLNFNGLPAIQNMDYSKSPKANALNYSNAAAVDAADFSGAPSSGNLDYSNAAALKQADFSKLANVGKLNYNNLSAIQNQDPSTLPAVFGDGDTMKAQARAEQALYSRMNPQFAQEEAALRDRLLNQGITQGSEAYRREFEQFNQAKTDARQQAILNGQQYGQSLLNQSLARRNQAVGEGQNQFQNSLAQRQQGVSEAGNIFNANQSLRSQQTNEQLAMQQASLAARQQGISEADKRLQANMGLRDQYTQEQLAAQQASLANRQQGIAEAGNKFQSDLTLRNSMNDEQLRMYQASLANRQNAAGEAQSQFDSNAALRAQMESEQQNRFQNSLTSRQQGISEGNTNLQNSLARRNQYINEYTTQRNAPLNEFSALTSGSQVQNPSFINQSYQGAAPTDVSGNIQNSYQGRLGQYNAQVAGRNQMMGNIFGVAGLALGAPQAGGGSVIGNALGKLF